MMKILMVIPAIGNIYGGTSKVVMELAQSISAKGVTVDLVTTNANGDVCLKVPLYHWVEESSYRIQYFPYGNAFDYKISMSLTQWLFRNINNYDLVHTHAIFSYPVLPAYWACQYKKVPYIMTPHGMLEPWAMAYKTWKKTLYYQIIEKPAFEKASAIQIIGSPEAKSVRALGIQTPLVLIPNGIHRQDFESLADPEIFYQNFPDTRNKTLIIFLGRIDPKKGLDLLATAFAQVHNLFPETHLIVAGQDNIGFLPTAQSYFAEAGCLNSVTFTGMLTGDLKYSALSCASIYVAPSYSEGFSMSILEGMVSGLPCVITTACNFPEAAAAKTALVVDINAEAIANAVIQCLQNTQEMKAMGDRARQFILNNYTWEQIADRMIDVYTAIINNNPLP